MVDRIDSPRTYSDIIDNYLLPSKPFILSSTATADWISIRKWVKNGTLDLTYLKNQFGRSRVPVADCGRCENSSQPKSDWILSDYLDYIETCSAVTSDSPCLYMKDWHFQREYPNYHAYSVPLYFTSDWLNEFAVATGDDDYRFVYIGVKGSWTPFHTDVLHSFSWSANICGRKKWIIYPKGQEDSLRDTLGNLPYDVSSVHDPDNLPITVLQDPGEVIFIPSGWYHQVHNLFEESNPNTKCSYTNGCCDCIQDHTISINHNWINGCNVATSWEYLKSHLTDVRREISDCQDMDGWHRQCQVILKASSGIDYKDFYVFLYTIATKRISSLFGNDDAMSDREQESNIDRETDLVTELLDQSEISIESENKTLFSCTQNDMIFSESETLFNQNESACAVSETLTNDLQEPRQYTSYTDDIGYSLHKKSDTLLNSTSPIKTLSSCGCLDPDNKHCPLFSPSSHCHLTFDLRQILQVLEDMVKQEDMDFIDFTDCHSQPNDLLLKLKHILK